MHPDHSTINTNTISGDISTPFNHTKDELVDLISFIKSHQIEPQIISSFMRNEVVVQSHLTSSDIQSQFKQQQQIAKNSKIQFESVCESVNSAASNHTCCTTLSTTIDYDMIQFNVVCIREASIFEVLNSLFNLITAFETSSINSETSSNIIIMINSCILEPSMMTDALNDPNKISDHKLDSNASPSHLYHLILDLKIIKDYCDSFCAALSTWSKTTQTQFGIFCSLSKNLPLHKLSRKHIVYSIDISYLSDVDCKALDNQQISIEKFFSEQMIEKEKYQRQMIYNYNHFNYKKDNSQFTTEELHRKERFERQDFSTILHPDNIEFLFQHIYDNLRKTNNNSLIIKKTKSLLELVKTMKNLGNFQTLIFTNQNHDDTKNESNSNNINDFQSVDENLDELLKCRGRSDRIFIQLFRGLPHSNPSLELIKKYSHITLEYDLFEQSENELDSTMINRFENIQFDLLHLIGISTNEIISTLLESNTYRVFDGDYSRDRRSSPENGPFLFHQFHSFELNKSTVSHANHLYHLSTFISAFMSCIQEKCEPEKQASNSMFLLRIRAFLLSNSLDISTSIISNAIVSSFKDSFDCFSKANHQNINLSYIDYKTIKNIDINYDMMIDDHETYSYGVEVDGKGHNQQKSSFSFFVEKCSFILTLASTQLFGANSDGTGLLIEVILPNIDQVKLIRQLSSKNDKKTLKNLKKQNDDNEGKIHQYDQYGKDDQKSKDEFGFEGCCESFDDYFAMDFVEIHFDRFCGTQTKSSLLSSIEEYQSRRSTVTVDGSSSLKIDASVHEFVGLCRSLKRVATFDMDSTLIRNECIDEMADFVGVGEEVKEITRLAMNGKLDFAGALKSRVALLKHQNYHRVFDHVIDSIRYTPDAKLMSGVLYKLGLDTAVISGGFFPVINVVADHLKIKNAFANTMQAVHEARDESDASIDSNKSTFSGMLEPSAPLVDAHAKESHLKRMCIENHVGREFSLAMGDGANDLKMLSFSLLGIAILAKPHVQLQTQFHINQMTLLPALYYMGISNEMWMKAMDLC